MINHKYRHLFTFCLAGLILSIFSPGKIRQCYPTVSCQPVFNRVDYWRFTKHSWVLAAEVEAARAKKLEKAKAEAAAGAIA